jgi:hypothetical protein
MAQPSSSPAETLRSAACTIVSPNYLAYARTVAASYLAHHPNDRFFVLLVASLQDATPFDGEQFTAVLLSEIGLDDLPAAAMKYEILELNTNVKPTFLKHLLARYHLARLTYLDPDIFVYAPLTPAFEALETNDAVLTPHLTTPIFDGKQPGEQEMLYNGTYNLGFIAIRNTPEALRLLSWWERRCLDLGFSEGRTGLFVDQKWMNLAPGLFECVAILRHPGCNMAYWNLNDRTLTGDPAQPLVAGANVAQPVSLCFFHFSGIVLTDPAVLSKNTDRFTLASRPDLATLFAAYKAAVLARKDAALEAIPYGFDAFADGTAITLLARRIYAQHQALFAGQNPFAAEGPFLRFARDTGLLAGKIKPQKATWREFSGTDRRVETVHTLLKVALRLLGPNRYELLMRYLAHITVLRHQSVFLKPKE